MEIALQNAQKDEVAMIFMNQGVNKITKMTHPANIRPDVVIVYKSGKIDFIEVMSKTDTKDLLKTRVIEGVKNIPSEVINTIKIEQISQKFKK